ncbi:MAG: Fur family transcriptional regulator [Ardenticatenaceae bacterium]
MNNNIKKRMDQMVLMLQKNGFRITPPRKAVLQVMAEGHQHLSHGEILEQARQKYPNIGRATVYRTVELLLQIGLIHATYLGDANQRFIVPMAGHHHHLVCNNCGDVTDLDECHFGHALFAITRQTGFKIDSHLVELYGTCTSCQ